MSKIYIRTANTVQLETVLRWSGRPEDLSLIADCEDVSFKKICEMVSCAAQPPRLYFCLPHVTRQNRLSSIQRMIADVPEGTGLMIRDPDQLEMILEAGVKGPVIADSGLYAYNSRAFSVYRQLLPEMKFLASDELTDRELAQTGEDVIYKVYGHQLLMVSNQCIRKNSFGCVKESGSRQERKAFSEKEPIWFRNDRGDRFFVRTRCACCYSCIYDGRITFMPDKMEEIPYENILADLTIEDAEQTEDLLRLLEQARSGGIAGKNAAESVYTRGHHYKGVE